MLPLNIVMPAVKRPAAMRFCGATVVARRRTPECMSCKISARSGYRMKAGRMMYLILCSGAPVRETRGVCDALLQAMCAESSKRYACRTVDTTDSPECHCGLSSLIDESVDILLLMMVDDFLAASRRASCGERPVPRTSTNIFRGRRYFVGFPTSILVAFLQG